MSKQLLFHKIFSPWHVLGYGGATDHGDPDVPGVGAALHDGAQSDLLARLHPGQGRVPGLVSTHATSKFSTSYLFFLFWLFYVADYFRTKFCFLSFLLDIYDFFISRPDGPSGLRRMEIES